MTSPIGRPARQVFSGWRIVGLATLTGALTGPGQTIGVSVFIDHFIADLGATRSQVSTAYLVGTMSAATLLPFVGRSIDRVGVRRAMTLIGAAFAVALTAMAGVRGLVSLTIGFVGIRLLGQGALTLASTVAVTHWFERRRGAVLGVFNTGVAVLMSLVPVGLSGLIAVVDWRRTWLIAAAVVAVTVVPIARFGMIDRPADVGQRPDGDDVQVAATPRVGSSVSRSQAVRTYRFWVLAFSMGAVSMLVTALNFHQISLLGDAGLSVTEAAAMFLPQTIGAAVAGVLFGYLADRLSGRLLIIGAMAVLATALLLAADLSTGWMIGLYAVLLGAAGGGSRSVGSTLLPRWFGLGHIGAIHGVATLIGVAASSLGPVALSLARDNRGGYGPAAVAFIAIPMVAALAATGLGRMATGSDAGTS